MYVYHCYLGESLYSTPYINDCITAYESSLLLSYADFRKFYESHKGGKVSMPDESSIKSYLIEAENKYNASYTIDTEEAPIRLVKQTPYVAVAGNKKRRTYKSKNRM